MRQAIIPKKEQEGASETIDKQKENINNMFEVVEKVIILKTKNGTYEKINQEVKYGDKIYKSPNEADEEKNIILEKVGLREEEIKKEFEKLNSELEKLNNTRNKVLITAHEIKAAFNYIG